MCQHFAELVYKVNVNKAKTNKVRDKPKIRALHLLTMYYKNYVFLVSVAVLT